MKTLITFDIDGTLLSLKKEAIMEYVSAYADTFNELFGKPENFRDFIPPNMAGLTDLEIIRYSVTKALNKDINDTSEEIENKFKQFLTIFPPKFQAKFVEDNIILTNGVKEILQDLKARNDVILGVCTGNLKEIGEIKLIKAGILEYFNQEACGYALHRYRGEMLKQIIENVKQLDNIQINKVIHIGDTTKDVEAAHYVNAIPVLVKQWNMDPEATCTICTVEDFETGKEKIISLL